MKTPSKFLNQLPHSQRFTLSAREVLLHMLSTCSITDASQHAYRTCSSDAHRPARKSKIVNRKSS